MATSGLSYDNRSSPSGFALGNRTVINDNSSVLWINYYIYSMRVQKKIVIERTRDLIYLKFVATDFFLKILSPSAGENSGDLA